MLETINNGKPETEFMKFGDRIQIDMLDQSGQSIFGEIDQTVTQYVDINAPAWGVSVHADGRERGFQSFACHPQVNEPGTGGLHVAVGYREQPDRPG